MRLRINSSIGVTGLALFAACGCTTDLNSLVAVDDRQMDASQAVPMQTDSGVGFPPPMMDDPIVEPDEIFDPGGPFALTLLHGVVDAAQIFFCTADDNGSPLGLPWPVGGLAFGQALVVREIEGLDLSQQYLQLIVIAASQEELADRSCEAVLNDPETVVTLGSPANSPPEASTEHEGGATEALAQGSDAQAADATTPDAEDASSSQTPAVRAAFLAAVPPNSLRSDGSYLYAVAGCLGATDLAGSDRQAVCGTNYFFDRPSLTPLLVRMSRLVSSGVSSLQFLQASLGAGKATLRSVPSILQEGLPVTIATDVSAGVIAPYPPLRNVSTATLGVPLASALLQIESEFGATWEKSWGSALSQGKVDELLPVNGYTVVFVGPNPWLEAENEVTWNAPQVSVVKNSP